MCFSADDFLVFVEKNVNYKLFYNVEIALAKKLLILYSKLCIY